ncbi:phosphoribosylpyrophosphate synthetase [Chryseolinea sp. H1M3-3]|uniref:phosphoribosylpyrophosphate synthetase n=1 Tax=Chryseolinea sp. H1M3-3 TaxID=3034144 RepID=UPI0023EE05D8|nr:phosphoribosylpyrophosphate synthetase [Chryseolinea sp. H1M3-3]
MTYYATLSEALNALKNRGYREDFNLKPHCIECASLSLELHPENFTVDEFHRFEGMSNPDDNSIVFAISSKDGIKGTLVDAYGMYADNLSESMIKKLAIKR